jgi:hypothetical protein
VGAGETLAFLERMDLEGFVVYHPFKASAKNPQYIGIRLQRSKDLVSRVETSRDGNVSRHETQLGIRAPTMRRTEEDDGIR